MTLVYISAAWLAGIFLGLMMQIPAALLAVSLLPLLVLIFRRSNLRTPILAAVCTLTFVGAALYYPLHLPTADESAISFYQGDSPVTLKGIVSSPPEQSGDNIRFRFAACEVEISGQPQKVSGTALVYVPSYSEYRYGDFIMLSGQLEMPPRFEDFDYRDYLAHQGISTVIYHPGIEILGHDRFEDTGMGV